MTPTVSDSPAQPVNNAHGSIGHILKWHLRETNRHLAFLKRLKAKPEPTAADWKAFDRWSRRQRGREQAMDDLADAHPMEAWAKAYVSAVRTESTPKASEVAGPTLPPTQGRIGRTKTRCGLLMLHGNYLVGRPIGDRDPPLNPLHVGLSEVGFVWTRQKIPNTVK
jgi:hypothetical protein